MIMVNFWILLYAIKTYSHVSINSISLLHYQDIDFSIIAQSALILDNLHSKVNQCPVVHMHELPVHFRKLIELLVPTEC